MEGRYYFRGFVGRDHPTIRLVKSRHASGTTDDVTSARAYRVVLCGQRYGFISAVVGILPLMDAIILLKFANSCSLISKRIIPQENDSFICDLSISMLGCITVVRVATIISYGLPGLFDSVVEACISVLLLVVSNHITNLLHRTGVCIGKSIARQKTMITQNQNAQPRTPNTRVMDGIFAFSLWLWLIGTVIVS